MRRQTFLREVIFVIRAFSSFVIRASSFENAFVILRSAFSFRAAISPPAQLLQLIPRGQKRRACTTFDYLTKPVSWSK